MKHAILPMTLFVQLHSGKRTGIYYVDSSCLPVGHIKRSKRQQGLKLITRKRKNMKPNKLSDREQQLLDQRGIVETIIGHLKHHYQIWHTRYRSVINAMTH